LCQSSMTYKSHFRIPEPRKSKFLSIRAKTLTRYCCILILDQANRNRLNILMLDLKGSAYLTGKAEYIETPKTIGAKY